MAWIKFEKDLQTDPRVLRMARAVQCNAAALPGCNASALHAVTLVCGALVRLWCLADTHVAEDDILDLPAAEIDAIIGIPGFCATMPSDWFEDLGERVKLPDFHKHNGTEAKKKAVTQKRVERHRTRNAPALHGGNGKSVTRPRPDQTRPDHIKERARAEAARASRLPLAWLISPELLAWTRKEKPGWDDPRIAKVTAQFKDHWKAKGGKEGARLDWDATWRTWVRRENDPTERNAPPVYNFDHIKD